MSDGLLPATPPVRKERIDRELPKEARGWGRILDLTHLEAGDLLLFRNVPPHVDRVGHAIVSAQTNGGLHERHAQWTHAAVYLGDGEHVCEANFGLAGFPYGVIMRSVHCYCDGTYAIRARRPRNMGEQQRLRIALGAMTNLGKGYSLGQIFSFWNAARTGRGFWSSTRRGPRFKVRALVCSTLYQDAFNFAYQGTTVRMGSLCTPAHLSASSDFEVADPQLNWLEIE